MSTLSQSGLVNSCSAAYLLDLDKVGAATVIQLASSAVIDERHLGRAVYGMYGKRRPAITFCRRILLVRQHSSYLESFLQERGSFAELHGADTIGAVHNDTAGLLGGSSGGQRAESSCQFGMVACLGGLAIRRIVCAAVGGKKRTCRDSLKSTIVKIVYS